MEAGDQARDAESKDATRPEGFWRNPFPDVHMLPELHFVSDRHFRKAYSELETLELRMSTR